MWLGTRVWSESLRRLAEVTHGHMRMPFTINAFSVVFWIKNQLEQKSVELHPGQLRKRPAWSPEVVHVSSVTECFRVFMSSAAACCHSLRGVNMMQKNIYSLSCSCFDGVLMSSFSWSTPGDNRVHLADPWVSSWTLSCWTAGGVEPWLYITLG